MKTVLKQFVMLSVLGLSAVAFNAQAIPITLNSGSGSFDGELRVGVDSPNVGVVLLHGRGGNPNSAVVRQLGISLNNSGYSTLSIENPIPFDFNSNGVPTDFYDYVADVQSGTNYVFPEMHARVQASIDYFQTQGVEQIVIAGFSLGSRFASEFVASGEATNLPVVGLVGIGMYGNSIGPLNVSVSLQDITMPVLDIYGDADWNAVNTAAARMAAFGGNPADYTQLVLDCADGIATNDCHKLSLSGLKGADDRPLETTVRNWMQQIAPLAVPAPTTLSLLMLGLVGMGLRARK